MGSYTVNWCDHCGEKTDGLKTVRYGLPSDWPGIGSTSPSTYKEAALCPDCLDAAFRMLNRRVEGAKR